MNLHACIDQLAANAETIRGLVQGVSAEQASWKPAPEEWSILEVVNHLYDEEREDFRTRLEFTLHQPGQAWPPIDPEGWAIARQYNQRELQASLDGLLIERQTSLAWLQSLEDPDWAAVFRHPSGRVIRAGDLLASWVAHDFLHIRQITDLQRAYLPVAVAPYTTDYADA